MRIDQWDDNLMSVIMGHEARPYEAGSSDCWTMAMESIAAVTGVRPYADVKYKTDARGVAIMRKRGFETIGQAIGAVLSPRDKGHVQRGDIALLEVDTGIALCVVVGGGIAWRSDTVKLLPMTSALSFLAVE